MDREVEISDLLEILETTQDETERYILQTMVTGRVNFIKEIEKADTADTVEVVRCKECKHRFLEIVGGKKVFSCLYRMGTLDLNGYCDCGVKMDEVTE